MALQIPASEIAIGDYIPEEGKGTVTKVHQTRGMIHIVFRNGNDLSVDPETEFMVDQGGRF